jgi:hypothetical protein
MILTNESHTMSQQFPLDKIHPFSFTLFKKKAPEFFKKILKVLGYPLQTSICGFSANHKTEFREKYCSSVFIIFHVYKEMPIKEKTPSQTIL